jgi:hypothetical protein
MPLTGVEEVAALNGVNFNNVELIVSDIPPLSYILTSVMPGENSKEPYFFLHKLYCHSLRIQYSSTATLNLKSNTKRHEVTLQQYKKTFCNILSVCGG